MENYLPTKVVLHFSAALLVPVAKLIRFGQVLHRLKPDFWLSFRLKKSTILAFPSAASLLGWLFPFQQKSDGRLVSRLRIPVCLANCGGRVTRGWV